MFDFSFGEMGLIAVVALLVLGPERLPRVARTAGALVRRARNSWQSVRDEIERELQTEELKRSLDEAKRAATDLHNNIQEVSSGLHATVEKTAAEIETAAAPGVSPGPASTQDAVGHEQR